MPIALLLLLMGLSLSHAQYSEQPLKESTADLRSQTVLFKVEIVASNETYILERTAGQDYFLRRKFKNEETMRKIAGRDAIQLDRDFASRFLRCQYEIPSQAGECKVTLRLNMKGEGQEICNKDDQKSQEIVTFVRELSKRF